MYVCGMTVYDYCHIGHARVMWLHLTTYIRFLRSQGWESPLHSQHYRY
ncbi:hypothetical protein ABVN80_17835 [Acinetobacter baumannii]